MSTLPCFVSQVWPTSRPPETALASRLLVPCPTVACLALCLLCLHTTVPTTVPPAGPASESLPCHIRAHSHTHSFSLTPLPVSNSFPPWSVRPNMTIFFSLLISHPQAPDPASRAPWSGPVHRAARRPSDMPTPSLPSAHLMCPSNAARVLPLRAPDLAPSFAILPPCYSISLRPAHLTVGHSTSC